MDKFGNFYARDFFNLKPRYRIVWNRGTNPNLIVSMSLKPILIGHFRELADKAYIEMTNLEHNLFLARWWQLKLKNKLRSEIDCKYAEFKAHSSAIREADKALLSVRPSFAITDGWGANK